MAFAASGFASPLRAQVQRTDYPTKTVRLLVPFPAGGAADVVARMIAADMGTSLGRPVVVENRAGASGNIAMDAAARSEPDGHTILLASASLAINPTLIKATPWALRHALLETVKALEVQATDRPVQTARFGIPGVAPKSAGRDVSLRAEILCAEGRWTEASALVQPPAACRDPVLRTIAMHLPTSHADQALALLLRVFDNAMRQASSPYRGELALAGEIGQRLGAARRADWLARLRVEYKAKRNFVRDLPAG